MANVDVAPTILDFFGIPIPKEMTGEPIRVDGTVDLFHLHQLHLDQRHIRLPIQLAEVAFGRLLALGDVEPVVTRARHRSALERALAELDAFWAARTGGVDAAATATHLRAAVLALDDLIGTVTPEDVLDRVFAAFCVGK